MAYHLTEKTERVQYKEINKKGCNFLISCFFYTYSQEHTYQAWTVRE